MTDIYDFSAETLDGSDTALGAYKGKTMLIVNVASKCGFTPQYQGLEALYRKFAEKGLVVLGFPCNQFGHQEPGDADEIRNFCSRNYDVTFPIFSKIEVNGSAAHPLYKFLKSQAKGIFGTERIKWNFTKFLVDGEGRVIARYPPTAKPQRIEKDVAALL
ncbi:MAG: glutathione peroxidase [Steroidobacteraceae bacterium]